MVRASGYFPFGMPRITTRCGGDGSGVKHSTRKPVEEDIPSAIMLSWSNSFGDAWMTEKSLVCGDERRRTRGHAGINLGMHGRLSPLRGSLEICEDGFRYTSSKVVS